MSYNTENINRLIEIISALRAENGCPWDREQTHETLRENLIQESYEVIDAINSKDEKGLKEELGDVLLQVIFHSQIAAEEGRFTIDDVAKGIADKLVRRHPHVFGDVSVSGAQEVLVNWEKIKQKEKPERTSALSGVVKAQPALMTAMQLSKKAVKAGFEWPNEDSLWQCFYSEIEEFKEALQSKNSDSIQDEMGDLFFSMVNIARWHKVDPELALFGANTKFRTRFVKMEEMANRPLNEYTTDELENLWQMVKQELAKAKTAK